MSGFMVLVASLSLGGLAWGLLLFSDWLLSDHPRKSRSQH